MARIAWIFECDLLLQRKTLRGIFLAISPTFTWNKNALASAFSLARFEIRSRNEEVIN